MGNERRNHTTSTFQKTQTVELAPGGNYTIPTIFQKKKEKKKKKRKGKRGEVMLQKYITTQSNIYHRKKKQYNEIVEFILGCLH